MAITSMTKMNRSSRTSIALFFLLVLFALVAMAQGIVPARWPEVVGFTTELAQTRIRADMPIAQFQVLKVGTSVTMEFIPWRVRLFVDSAGIVAKIPVAG